MVSEDGEIVAGGAAAAAPVGGDDAGAEAATYDAAEGWREASEICTLDSNVYEEKGWRISATLTFSPVASLAS